MSSWISSTSPKTSVEHETQLKLHFSWATDDEIVRSITDEFEITLDKYSTLVAYLHPSRFKPALSLCVGIETSVAATPRKRRADDEPITLSTPGSRFTLDPSLTHGSWGDKGDNDLIPTSDPKRRKAETVDKLLIARIIVHVERSAMILGPYVTRQVSEDDGEYLERLLVAADAQQKDVDDRAQQVKDTNTGECMDQEVKYVSSRRERERAGRYLGIRPRYKLCEPTHPNHNLPHLPHLPPYPLGDFFDFFDFFASAKLGFITLPSTCVHDPRQVAFSRLPLP